MTIEIIEMNLKAMNDAAFHRLGDHYLFFDCGNEYDSIIPVGQAEGKQKSTKGTPDTRIKLKNGRYIFIQYTTQENNPKKSDFYKKLVADLEACFDPQKTIIPVEDIEHVVLFFNSNLNEATEKKLKAITDNYGVPLRLYNLTTIAHNIYKLYPYLAKDYLNVEIGTYQILPLSQFITEYEKSGMATPLSNPFHHRQNEINEIKALIEANMITVINGKSGVGKSKLAIEVTRQFSEEHSNYNCFCISNKDLPVINDLRKQLSTEKNALIFIDDVNKSIHLLREVFTWYAEREVHLKIILTVREYVYKQVDPFIKNYSNSTFNLSDFNEHEILTIISSEPFDIKDIAYQKKIIQLAKGNARLAVMASVASKDKPIEILDNVTGIYNEYFKTVSGDNPLLQNAEYLKILGILSFFRAIDRDNQTDTENIFTAFNIDEKDFWTKIYELESYEIVDVFSDKTTVKFTDQILEGYLFYKVYLADGLLSYDVILDQFYPSHSSRIKFTAIEGKTTFGRGDFETMLLPHIKKKYNSIVEQDTSLFDFFQVFYSYLPDETLSYIYRKIASMTKELPLQLLNKVANSNAHQKTFVFEGDKTIERYHHDSFFDLLTEFLKEFDVYFELSVQLMFDYIERKQEVAEKFVEFVSGYIAFSVDDEVSAFEKERVFSHELTIRVQTGIPIYTYIFLRLAPHFLKTTFFHHINYRGASVGSVSYKLIKKVRFIRSLYWQTFNTVFNNYRLLSLYTLDSIKNGLLQNDHQSLRASDWKHMEAIFNQHFDSEIFIDAYTINKIITDLTKRKKSNGVYGQYLNKVNTEKYRWFKILDFDIWGNHNIVKLETESHSDFRERFKTLKAKEILSTFNYKNAASYLPVLDLIGDCVMHNIWQPYNNNDAAQILFSNMLHNEQMFLELFEEIVVKPYFFRIVRFDTFFNSIQQIGSNLLNKVETVLFAKDFINYQYVRLDFFNALHQENITKKRCLDYKELLATLSGNFYLAFENIAEYCTIDTDFLNDALPLMLERAKTKSFSFRVKDDFISKEFKLFNSIIIAEGLYVYLSNSNYDYEGDELTFILKIRPAFLSRYLDSIVNYFPDDQNDHNELLSLWHMPEYIKYVTVIFDKFITHHSFFFKGQRVLDHLIESAGNPEVATNKKLLFFEHYISLYNCDEEKMRACFKIIQNKFHDNFKQLFIKFLGHNQDIDLFKKIRWTDQGIIIRSGNSILGEIEEGIWTRIKSIVEEMKPHIRFLEHKIFINKEIDYCRKHALWERKRDFLGGR
ncbi:hypothetical protein ACLI09_02625 [Flavobacterium sp. RHBU_24]|uniref:nSTAND3 domain-containing NTPase n=1 Tax=Flavobacterium sp. RHBU_24 TaxID=3391185 RepID=UPI0039846F10